MKPGDQAAGSHGGCGIYGGGLIVDARGHGWSGSRMTLLPPGYATVAGPDQHWTGGGGRWYTRRFHWGLLR